MHRKLWGTGLNARKTTLGAEYLERSLSTVNDINRERQDMLVAAQTTASTPTHDFVIADLSPSIRPVVKFRTP